MANKKSWWSWLSKEKFNIYKDFNSPPPPPDPKPKDKFIIEHYPYTNKYAVKYKNGYLKKGSLGIIRIETMFDIVDFYNTVGDAKRAITLYKEQRFKVGVEVVQTID